MFIDLNCFLMWAIWLMFENFNLAYNFWTVSSIELLYFTWVFLVIRPFHGYLFFLPCDLDIGVFSLFFFKNVNLANDFWTVSARALIFHMSIPCDKTFLWFHYFLINIRAFILHMSISCDMIVLLVSRYLSLWTWPSLELAIIGGICVSQTHLV